MEYVRIPRPLQFVLGDTVLSRPFVVPVVAYGADSGPIGPFVASVGIEDGRVATCRRLRLARRARGIAHSWATARRG